MVEHMMQGIYSLDWWEWLQLGWFGALWHTVGLGCGGCGCSFALCGCGDMAGFSWHTTALGLLGALWFWVYFSWFGASLHDLAKAWWGWGFFMLCTVAKRAETGRGNRWVGGVEGESVSCLGRNEVQGQEWPYKKLIISCWIHSKWHGIHLTAAVRTAGTAITK